MSLVCSLITITRIWQQQQRRPMLRCLMHTMKADYCSVNESTRVKIYTRTGDKGTSSLYTLERRPKDDVVFEALGANDELTSAIGFARELCKGELKAAVTAGVSSPLDVVDMLANVQCTLQDVGSCIATPRTSSKKSKVQRTKFNEELIDHLESQIDLLDAPLVPLTAFILPSGSPASAALHVARTACRRAERRVVPLVRDGEVEDAVGRFLNRLSDFLFTTARYVAHFPGGEVITYKKMSTIHSNTE